MATTVTCGCGQRFAAQPQLAGRQVPCPACGAPLRIPSATSSSTAGQAAAPAHELVVQCRCGGRFAAQPQLAGKRVACPACGQPLAVPQPGAAALTDLSAADLSAEQSSWKPQDIFSLPASSAPRLLPSRPYRACKPREFNARPFIIGGVILTVLIAVFGVGLVVWNVVSALVQHVGGQTPTVGRDYAEVRREFQTVLSRHGPAPQDYEPLQTPSGAVQTTYRSGNLTLTAYVAPATSAGGKHPAVLFLHGGFAFGEEDWQMAQPYRDAGFVVMTPVLRGENGQPGHFTLYFDEVDDVLAAADALAQLPYVDSQQIFVAGHSAGGTLAALAAMASNRFRAAAPLCGCMDQRLNADIAPFYRLQTAEFRVRSPVDFATSFKCPTRLYYGSQEAELSVANEQTAKLAKAGGLDVVAIRVPGDHFSAAAPALYTSIDFFRQQLSQGNSPTPRAANPVTESLPSEPVRAMPPSSVAPTGAGDWITYTPPRGSYRVLLPGTPVIRTQSVPTATRPVLAEVAAVVDERDSFGCSVTQIVLQDPALASASMDKAACAAVLDAHIGQLNNEMQRRLRVRLVREEAISLQGYPGRELYFENSTTSPIVGYRVRYFLVNTDFYQLQWVCDKGSLRERQADIFFSSFRPAAASTATANSSPADASSFAPPPPPLPTMPPRVPSGFASRAVVVFEIRGYTGTGDKLVAARSALAGIPWADTLRMEVQDSTGDLVVGVRGTSVSTGAAKVALERAGFEIGRTTYRPMGL